MPIDSEGDLYYHEWVADNIKKVSDATGDKVGYLHVPDMQVERPEPVQPATSIRKRTRRR